MTLDNIFAISAAVLTSIGGAGAIILGLSSWLGKVWASRLLEAEKHELQKKLTQFTESLKQENNIEIEEIKLLINNSSHVFKLEKDHEYDQRKKIKEIISKNKIRMIDAAESLNHRLWNFYNNHQENWHIYSDNNFPNGQEYLTSFIYRMLMFYGLCRSSEKEMLYLDSTIAIDKDLFFVKFLKILPQVMTDLMLFEGLNYDKNHAKDHFFKENFHTSIEQMIDNDSGNFLSYNLFKKKVSNKEIDVSNMAKFISGMSPKEDRLRWQRLQTMHYLLLMFINTYGYDFQYTTKDQITELKNKYPMNSTILDNFKILLNKFKLLENQEVKIIIDTLID